MAHIDDLDETLDLDEPLLIEGLPGVGLVGKIATDHLVDTFEMVHAANVLCDSLPPVTIYGEGERGLKPPVRLYADEQRDLLVLRSDVPVAPGAATEFADCLGEWLSNHGATPIYLSGLPRQKDEEPPELYGVATGDGGRLLDDAEIERPSEGGLVSGPTGALLHHAFEEELTAAGLIVESDPQFPDPEAARVVLKHGIQPLVDAEMDVGNLVERAEEIREAKEQLAQRMQAADSEATQAQPIRGFQ